MILGSLYTGRFWSTILRCCRSIFMELITLAFCIRVELIVLSNSLTILRITMVKVSEMLQGDMLPCLESGSVLP
nr:hypothetical protein Iba_chr08bCG5480 [Ipomoea batatas]GMD24826.1 hypothetical protein Iba_chr08cCG4290 [Ipomoea batatas]GMD26620.1 hypothetical protein Iba_chr08dCG6010 [Ipomoea batatas]GMD26621.1 hypothetical protein Iba_chr08dCG6020 [Ipomoea batatas]